MFYRLIFCFTFICSISQAQNIIPLPNGLQSLTQLIHGTKNGQIACSEIVDQPRFEWRGVMLDESRHFFGMEEVTTLFPSKFIHIGGDEVVSAGLTTHPLVMWWRHDQPKMPDLALKNGYEVILCPRMTTMDDIYEKSAVHFFDFRNPEKDLEITEL